MELTKVDGVDETMVGSNVTLICRNYYGTDVSIQPTWAYRNNINESIQMINETNPPKGNNSMQIPDCIRWSHTVVST